ncbi:DegV family protein, partial [Streptococcus pyogenes]|uniref:DegV family protein n=1 Tax=Streptococcus pyogenes TaxID=1314 RepID=UPI0011E724A0
EIEMAFPDSKITSSPLGSMVKNVRDWSRQGMTFHAILNKLHEQIDGTTAFIMVDDLNHLVKGGRLSNGSALLGNLLSIKPILRFFSEGKIVVSEKVRTEKFSISRFFLILNDLISSCQYNVFIIHSKAQ